ncbi:unnamed protein product [Lymnaea stagnalis]|uniref:THD domain-containing protein n=1 Tax=Lymnaea stagnalis TaxID=6523 RepID=A0AAV2IFW8_LYMST
MNSYLPLMPNGTDESALAPYWNTAHSITETSFTTMAKDTRVTFDSAPCPEVPVNKPSQHKVHCHRGADRQISYEDAENCVNEMSESFPALSTRAHRLMRQVSGSFNSRTIKVALILSVILNLLLAVPFGIFFGIWMSQKSDATSSPATTSVLSPPLSEQTTIEFCVLCSDLNKFEMKLVKVKSKNGICCINENASDFDEKRFVFPLLTDVRGSIPCRPGTRGQRSESDAHLLLDVKKTKLNVEGKLSVQKLFHWMDKNENDLSFVGSGLKYSPGTISILQSGKYYLYSHLTISTNESPLPGGAEEKIVVHSILKSSQGHGLSTLLTNQLTVRQKEASGSTINGVVELSAGDEVYVYFSYPSLLKDTVGANIFGLFLL